jgi:hypothetical protein
MERDHALEEGGFRVRNIFDGLACNGLRQEAYEIADVP